METSARSPPMASARDGARRVEELHPELASDESEPAHGPDLRGCRDRVRDGELFSPCPRLSASAWALRLLPARTLCRVPLPRPEGYRFQQAPAPALALWLLAWPAEELRRGARFHCRRSYS